ncbi:MAG TPA: insulinase family protein [Allosphingosinicella sp.]|jgi:zinc protease|nr:insulinase family protein [Allosphingosinicella sp.]
MVLGWFGRGLVAAAALLLAGAPARAIDPIPANARAALDPAVRTGTLANGLRYAIMRNGTPARALSIRLAIRAGSYDETDSEEGFAHFIEHMAFRSTKQAPQGSLDTRFANLGVAFGRDENATTGLEATIYQMDVPVGDAAALAKVLEWLRGAADGILFTPAAVELERGVVLAELRARTSPATLMMRETARFQAPGLRSMTRDVGGTEASLRAATPAGLQAYYDRWYRPENAVLVIAGDADPEALLKTAESAFGSWRGRGAAGTRAVPPPLPRRGLEAFTRSDPSIPLTGTACRIAALDGPRDGGFEQLRRETLSQIWVSILTERASQAAARSGSTLLGAAPIVNRGLPDARMACLIAVPNQGKWREGLAEAQAELRRFAETGPTPLEVETAAEQLRSRLRAAVYQSGTRSTRDLAQAIADSELDGRPFLHPREAMRVYDLLVAGLTPADVKRAFEADWAGNGPLLTLTGPVEASREDLVAAWRANESAAPLASFADPEAAQWAYPKFGKRGKVVSREERSGFTRLLFKNGAALNFKQTDFQSGGVEIRVRFGHGERGLSAADRMPMMLAAGLFPNGGLGRMDYAQIGSALANSTWAFTLEARPTLFVLSSSTLSDNVEQEMRLLAAYMTDPGFRPLIDEKLPTALDLSYRLFSTDPSAVANLALERALFPGRESLPPRERLAAYRAADFERMLKPALTRSPVEVTIVGDISEQNAIETVATTFGALPRRPKLPPPPAGAGPFRYFPERLPAPVTETHKGPADKAAAVLAWPLYVANPERRREEYSLHLLRSILETRLLRQVRVVMGKVYAPAVGMNTPDDADQGMLSVALEASPQDIDPLVQAALGVTGELARGRISQEELDDARTPILATADQALRDNGSWASALTYAGLEPEAMRELTGLREDLQALTLDDVRRAAATWLTPRPMVARALPAPR